MENNKITNIEDVKKTAKEDVLPEKTADAAEEVSEELSDKETGILVHRFSNPFEYQGVSYDTLRFDFGKLTGRDGSEVEKEMLAMNNPVIYRKLHSGYLRAMAVRACDQPIGSDAFDYMRINDCNKIQDFARDFFA